MGLGLDFGTTNSSLAIAGPDGIVSLATFPFGTSTTESFRSLLYLERIREGTRSIIKSYSGPGGIDRYLQAHDSGRLVQSLKSFLTSRSLQSTEVFGRRIKLEELIARILRDLHSAAQEQFGPISCSVVVGRPVQFVGAQSEDDNQFALERLTDALAQAGFANVSFELEPLGAAYHYESTLAHDELILIGDFGGGTSDFSLLRVGPSFRNGRAGRAVIGNEGLGLAGDAFDAKLVRHLVSPALGAGTMLRSGRKLLPVPNWVYLKLERWHHLSFLKTNETLSMLRGVRAQAQYPEKIDALLYLVQHDLGFHLHRAVQSVKVELSRHAQARFQFADGDVHLAADVTRTQFEEWIREELSAIAERVDYLLRNTNTSASAVDRVFLTGGSSFVPAVKRIFEERFGADRIRTGDEFTSVARGLALKAARSER